MIYILGNAKEENNLNFRVLTGTSAPSEPQENDIWLKTSHELTNGWEFIDGIPTWSMPENFVYIKTTQGEGYNNTVDPLGKGLNVFNHFSTSGTNNNGTFWVNPIWVIQNFLTRGKKI